MPALHCVAAALALASAQSSSPSPSPAPEDVPRIIEKMKASYGGESWSAVHALAHVGRPAVPALIVVLQDRSLPSLPNVKQPARYQAAFALGSIGAPAADAVPALLAILRDRAEDEGVRWAAASALGHIGHDPDAVVPALIAVLEEPGPPGSTLRWYAVGALAQLATRPAALDALKHAQHALRVAHGRMGGSGGFASIFRALEPPSRRKLAEEEDIREEILRHELKDGRGIWCIDRTVSDDVFKRLAPLKVTREPSECRLQPAPPASEVTAARYRHIDVEAIDWLSRDRVQTATLACFGYDPCSLTIYRLKRRRGRWTIISEERPPVM